MAQITSISNGEAMSSVRTKLNDVITNVNLLDPTDWTDYSSTSTIVGWSSFTDKIIFYRKIGKMVFINFSFSGTSNSTTVSFTLPVNLRNSIGGIYAFGFAVNNGTNSGSGSIQNSGVGTVVIYSNNIAGTWVASGTKSIRGQFFYIIE